MKVIVNPSKPFHFAEGCPEPPAMPGHVLRRWVILYVVLAWAAFVEALKWAAHSPAVRTFFAAIKSFLT